MDLGRVIFLGGNRHRFASVQVRCVDVATRLGCEYRLGVRRADEVPDRYAVFVCIKPDFGEEERAKLAARGCVVWDIIDIIPPQHAVGVYVASTRAACELFSDYGRVQLLPHHHCNFEGTPNPADLRRPAWIGSHRWKPALEGVDHDTYIIHKMGRAEVAQAFRRAGIGLNFRNQAVQAMHMQHRLRRTAYSAEERQHLVKLMFEFHLAVNSGIKLINCIGFGIPSVSEDEPAYQEIGPECTIFATPTQCGRWVRALQTDDRLYGELRKRCLRKAKKYHISRIAEHYRKFFLSL